MDMTEKLEAQKAWEYHKKFGERLKLVVARMVELEYLQEGERLMWCYPSNWYVTKPRKDAAHDAETITVRNADIRIQCSPDHERAEYSERYGCYYRALPTTWFDVPAEWLWSDDWQREFEVRELHAKLRMARYRYEQAIGALAEQKERVKKADADIPKAQTECDKFAQQLIALGEKVDPGV